MTIDLRTEIERIRTAYQKRRLDDARYTWSDPAYVFMLQNVERRVLRMLARQHLLPLSGKRILEVGCGTGHWLREFVKWGADPTAVAGVDLLPDRVTVARSLCPGGTRVFPCDAQELPFSTGEFDMVAHFTVFTSILDSDMKRRVAQESVRVLKPGGLVLWYDFHVANPRNPDVRPVGHRELSDLFPGCCISLERVTLAPPLVRLVAPRSWVACAILDTIPLLRTHYLAAVRKTGVF